MTKKKEDRRGVTLEATDKCDVCGEDYPELILGPCPVCGFIMCTDCLDDLCPKCVDKAERGG